MLKFKMAARGQLRKKYFDHFFNFYITLLATWRCAIDFFKYATITKIQNGRQRATPKICLCAKTLKKFTITFPTLWRCADDFFQGFTEIQNGRHGSTSYFLWPKYSKIEVINNSHFIITPPTIWKCEGDFTEIQNGRQTSTFYIFVIAKTLT